MFEKKPFISKLASLMMALAVVSVGEAQVKPATSVVSPTPAVKRDATQVEKQKGHDAMSKHRDSFVENKGQWDSHGKFVAERPGMSVWVTDSGLRLNAYTSTAKERIGHVFGLEYVGSQKPTFVGVNPDNMVWDYMVRGGSAGHHPAKGYAEVIGKDIYPGVDVDYHLDGGSPRFDFHVKPNQNPSEVKLHIRGAEAKVVNKGELAVKTSIGEISMGKIRAYQVVGGKEKDVTVAFQDLGNGNLGFKIGSYDKSRELVIDPLIYGTYFGGDEGWDEVHAVATDTSQGTYITGVTMTSSFPANYGPYRLTVSGFSDAFVAKLQGDVYNRDYAAIFGGSAADEGDYVQVDRQGNIWVAGLSTSPDFPGSSRDDDWYIKQDRQATAGTISITVRNTLGGGGTTITVPYNFTAAQLQAALRVAYPKVVVTAEDTGDQLGPFSYQMHFPYPYRVTVTVDSSGTWPRLIQANAASNYYYLGKGATAPGAGTFGLSGSLNGVPWSTLVTIPYNATAGQLQAALNSATGANWNVVLDPTAAATATFPGNPLIIQAPPGGTITSYTPSGTFTGSLVLSQMSATNLACNPAFTLPNGGTFNMYIGLLPFPYTEAWPPIANPYSGQTVTSLTAAMLQADLNPIVTAAATTGVVYAAVVPTAGSIPYQGPLTILTVQSPGSRTPLFTPSVQFGGQLSLLPHPNYFAYNFQYAYLMRFKADPNTVLTPEPGAEKVVTWGAPNADVTVNGFNVYKISDTPSNNPVPFVIGGTSFQRGQTYYGKPVSYQFQNGGVVTSAYIPGFNWSLNQISYRFRLSFDPVANKFSASGAPLSGYDGDGAIALLRGSTVDAAGNQVIAGTVFYNSNFDTRNANSPFVTTANVYNQDGFDGRLLRQDDIFVRKYSASGVMTSSCLVGGNLNDIAGGYDTAKELELSQDNRADNAPWPGNTDINGDADSPLFQPLQPYVGPSYYWQQKEVITGSCVAVDTTNNVYVTGISGSYNFPRTRGVYGETFDQFAHVTVTKLAPDLSQLLYSTNLRTSNDVLPGGIAVGPGGVAFVTGNIHPWTVDFPHPPATDPLTNQPSGTGASAIPITLVANGYKEDGLRVAYNTPGTPEPPTADGWLMVLNSTATDLVYSSYIGADLDDRVFQPYVDKFGDCWLSGMTVEHRKIWRQIGLTATTPTITEDYTDMGASFDPSFPLLTQMTSLAFKRNIDQSLISDDHIAYGILDTRVGPDLPLFIPVPGTFDLYTESRDGFVQRYRFGLPVLTGITYDQPTLAGGLGNISNGSVILSSPAPAPGINVTLTMANNSAASFSSGQPVFQTVITVPTGSTVGTFPVYTNTVSALTNVDITAAYQGDVKVGRLVVAPWFSSLALTPASVVGGQSVQGSVRIFQAAPASGVPISVSSSYPALVSVPTLVTVPSGQLQSAFVVNTFGVTTQTVVQVSAQFAGYGGQQQLTLNPASLFTLTFSPTTVDGRTAATGTLKLDGIPGKKFSVSPIGLPSGFSVSPNPIIFDPNDTTQYPTTRNFTLSTTFLANDTNATITFRRNDILSQTLSGQVQVLADPVTNIQVTQPTVTGGSATSVSVSITNPASKGGAYVHVASSSPYATLQALDGKTYSTSIIALIPEGASTVSIPVNTAVVVSDTTVNFTADRGTPATGVPTGGIVKTTATPLLIQGIGLTLSVTPTSIAGGSPATGTITLSTKAPAAGLNVNLSSNRPAFAMVPPTLTIPAGTTTRTFTVTTVQPQSGATSAATITASFSNKVARSIITVQAPQPQGLSFSPSTVTGGNVTVGTFTLDAKAQAGGAKVTLSSSNPLIATIPSSITVPAGKTSVSFNVPTSVVTGQKATTVTATFNGVYVTSVLQVVSANVGSLTLNPATVQGGTSSQCTVTLNTAAPIGGALVTLTLSNGTIASIPASVRIPAGQSSITFTVTTQPVSRTLSTTITANYNATQSAAILTITP